MLKYSELQPNTVYRIMNEGTHLSFLDTTQGLRTARCYDPVIGYWYLKFVVNEKSKRIYYFMTDKAMYRRLDRFQLIEYNRHLALCNAECSKQISIDG